MINNQNTVSDALMMQEQERRKRQEQLMRGAYNPLHGVQQSVAPYETTRSSPAPSNLSLTEMNYMTPERAQMDREYDEFNKRAQDLLDMGAVRY